MTDDIHPGLDDIAITETRLSNIDGDSGELLVGGYSVGELAANATYEESVYLLLHDRLPTVDELETFRAKLSNHRRITDEVQALLRRAASEEQSPMDALRMGVAAATLGERPAETLDTAVRMVAIFPTLVATYWRYRRGKEPVEPRDDLHHAANYRYMLTGEEPTGNEVRGLETYLNTVIDHGLNASTLSARVVVSTESDVASAATAAVGTLKGPLHGGAPGPVLEMLRTVHESGDPEGYVRETLDAGERLMGFGHRVYRVRDPRAAVLESAAERFYRADGNIAFLQDARKFEAVATDMLSERMADRQLETNVEFYTALLLDGIGIPKELFTPTFAVSRVGGWMAHALEQIEDNRLIRPGSRYVGATDRSWVPVESR